MSWENEIYLPNMPSIEGAHLGNLNNARLQQLYSSYPWLLTDERSRIPGFIQQEMNRYTTNPQALSNAQRAYEEARQRGVIQRANREPSIPLNTVQNTGNFNIKRENARNAISLNTVDDGEDIFYLMGEREIYKPESMNRLLRELHPKSPITRRNITTNTLRKAKAHLTGGKRKNTRKYRKRNQRKNTRKY